MRANGSAAIGSASSNRAALSNRSGKREVWTKPFSDDWRERPCALAHRATERLETVVYLSEDVHWVDREFVRSSYPDGRIHARFIEIGKAWVDNQVQSLPVIFPNRAQRKVVLEDGSFEKLPEYLSRQPLIAEKTMRFEECSGKRERTAKLDVHASMVMFRAPVSTDDQTPTQIPAVSVDERNAPDKSKPLDWVLLTTEGEPSTEQALKIVSWHESRWPHRKLVQRAEKRLVHRQAPICP